MLQVIKGFIAAVSGTPKSDNPYWHEFAVSSNRYDIESWNHGWSCYEIRVFPYAIEIQIMPSMRQEYADYFRRTGRCPQPVMDLLKSLAISNQSLTVTERMD